MAWCYNYMCALNVMKHVMSSWFYIGLVVIMDFDKLKPLD